jgi:hypothetical protein
VVAIVDDEGIRSEVGVFDFKVEFGFATKALAPVPTEFFLAANEPSEMTRPEFTINERLHLEWISLVSPAIAW